MMKKIFSVFAFVVLALNLALAQDYSELWRRAEEAYSAGNFEEAITAYENIAEAGQESSSLYYNIGNAYFRKGVIGKAILNYERALKLNPSDNDIKHNLKLSESMTIDKIDAVPGFILTDWVGSLRNSLSSDMWAVLSLIFLLAGLVLLFLYSFARKSSSRRLFFVAGIVVFLAVLGAWMFSVSLAKKAESKEYAVIVENIGSVKSSPAAGGNSLFVLHEGTKVKILEVVQNWYKIEIADGRQGWIKGSDIEII